MELVSIITPCYNGEKYVSAFLNSVLAQNYNNIELIFVDDGSKDNTKSIIESFKGKFLEKNYDLIYIYQENQGQAAAINKGLKIFKGKYLMWIDSDDILLPHNVELKIQYLKNNPDCGIVIGQGDIVNENDLNCSIGKLKRVKPEGEDTLFEDLLLERNVVFCPGVIMATRDCVIKSIPDLEIYESRQGQNWQMMLPMAYHFKCCYIEESVFKCVAHDDSHSRTKRSYEEEIKRIDGFIDIIKNTLKKIPDISEEELLRYNNIVDEHFCHRKIEISNKYFKVKDSLKYIKEIKRNNYTKKRTDNLIYVFLRQIKFKIGNNRRKK